MGLDMKTRKKVCEQIYKRYQRESKKGRKKILDEYSQTLGMNRDYLAHKLTNWGKTRYATIIGKLVKFVAKEPVKGRYNACGATKKQAGRKNTTRPLSKPWRPSGIFLTARAESF